jgi:hypothetical protein
VQLEKLLDLLQQLEEQHTDMESSNINKLLKEMQVINNKSEKETINKKVNYLQKLI